MISVKDLSFQYAGQSEWALKDVCLDIPRGECLLLTGPSGCGKSTLVKALNGLIPHFEKGVRAGRVLMDGVDLADSPMHRIAQSVGAVFQNPRSQFFTTRVADEIAFGCENMGRPRQELARRVELALRRFSITSLRERSVFSLSAGQRQKVILAAIFAMGPDIWVLDEPSANLDQASIQSLAGTIQEMQREGKTLIIAEHRCHYLRGLANRVVTLRAGRVSCIQCADEFFDSANEDMNRRGMRWVRVPDQIPVADAPSADIVASRLAVQHLGYRYPGAPGQALTDVNLTAAGGEIIALAGDSGAGKTTLAMLLCGLFRDREGRILIDGSVRSPKSRLRSCRLVLQESDHQFFTESVSRELELALSVNGGPSAGVTEMLAAIGLSGKAACRPHTLSGGEKQRLAAATALIAQPAIVILDEPTSGLDAKNMERIGALLQDVAARGGLVLVATHDLEFIQTCCTRVLRMQDGGVVHGPFTPS